jgi:hypothetical protein
VKGGQDYRIRKAAEWALKELEGRARLEAAGREAAWGEEVEEGLARSVIDNVCRNDAMLE